MDILDLLLLVIVVLFFGAIVLLIAKFGTKQAECRSNVKRASKFAERNNIMTPQLQRTLHNPQTVVLCWKRVLFLIFTTRIETSFLVAEPVDSQTINLYILKDGQFQNTMPMIATRQDFGILKGKFYIGDAKKGYGIYALDPKKSEAAENFKNMYTN